MQKVEKASKTSMGSLSISHIERKAVGNDKLRVEFTLKTAQKEAVLWYLFDRSLEQYLCDDRCDTAVTALTLAAMKYGYSSIESEYPISEKLYYNLQYHVIPQLYVGGDRRISRIKIKAPLTSEVFHGPLVATGMSRGVDSFASLYEYSENFELKEYRVNALTYFQAGAHHGFDHDLGHGTESRLELFQHQLQGTIDFCKENGYPLLAVQSNIREVLLESGLFLEKYFDRTHTFRNLSIAMLFQKGIRRYYYSSTYTLNDFKLTLHADMAYYERWLIPHLSTGSIEFFQPNQDWRRIDKVEKLTRFEPCYDHLQVCLIKTGNCGKCMKCRRTLMELDAYGDEALDKFKNSFDIETYKREDRRRWFASIVEDKEKDNSEAHYFEESFLCAAEHHPELLEYMEFSKAEGIHHVKPLGRRINIRKLPSLKSDILYIASSRDLLKYVGDRGPWIAIETPDGERAYIHKDFAELLP